MNKVKISLFALAAIFAVSCVQDPVMEESQDQTQVNVAKKIINSPEEAAKGKLVLFVSDELADVWANAEVATRSGVESVDAVAVEVGAETIRPVFNMNINGDAKRAQNLHRWFVVEFDDEVDLEAVANKYAANKQVSRVQYSTNLARPALRAYPAEEVIATRAASEAPFENPDPMLDLQWHYRNEGYQSIYQGAKEGEDINVFPAWEYTTGSSEVVVAVVDEGVKHSHPDLNANMWVNEKELNGATGKDDDGNGVIDDIYGYNCITRTGNITWDKCYYNESERAWDGDTGHGTHVAGTVAAVSGNGLGVAGVAGGSGKGDGVRIMSIQIFDGLSSGGLDGTAKGIEYAADMGASILQNSWGYPIKAGSTMTDSDYENYYGVELAAIRYFVKKSNNPAMEGSVAIFAAGNTAKQTADYPGAYNEFIAVTATSPDGLPTSYTNYKFGCNVAAPGGDVAYTNRGQLKYEGSVLSTLPTETIDSYTGKPYGTDYGYMSGTSMACAHVSGIAALVLSYAVENGIRITNTQLYDIITSSVRNIDDSLTGTKLLYPGYEAIMSLDSYKGNMGTGKIDALMAVMNVRGAQCVPATVGKELELKVANFVGNGDIKVKAFNGYEISEDTKQRLGIDKVEFFSTSVYLTCTKPGIGVITVKYIAGGDKVGGGATTGGKLMEKDIVIVSREANNNQGWL
ncbi:MAG: S8 family serine peptidase [Alistipes sp.]|nr:S8 family serine peptidase [Alistipes sp.]